jgi:NAD-dependent deacetylase
MAVCTVCGEQYEVRDVLNRDEEVPRCPYCHGVLKPATVLFGEPVSKFPKARDIAVMSDAVLVVGSSLSVYPAAYVPVIVKQRGGKVIIVNMEPTELDEIADVAIRGAAGEILPIIAEKIESAVRRPGN